MTTPLEHGYLDVGEGQLVYWESCGNPDGVPALVVHGGPGSGCTERMRRSFDPATHRTSCSTSAAPVEASRTQAARPQRWAAAPPPT